MSSALWTLLGPGVSWWLIYAIALTVTVRCMRPIKESPGAPTSRSSAGRQTQNPHQPVRTPQ